MSPIVLKGPNMAGRKPLFCAGGRDVTLVGGSTAKKRLSRLEGCRSL